MAATNQADPRWLEPLVLAGVSYKLYLQLSRSPKNRHVRMAYHDGHLELVSPPLFAHEGPSRRFSQLVVGVARALGLRFDATGGIAIHRRGMIASRGVGRIPDQAFYFGSPDRLPRHRALDLDAGDPPPDLWIEVDNTQATKGPLAAYAHLGIPEVWRFGAALRNLEFFRLGAGGYDPVDRSLVLPVLTPDRVLEAIIPGLDQPESEFLDFLDGWVPALIARAAGDPPA